MTVNNHFHILLMGQTKALEDHCEVRGIISSGKEIHSDF